MIEANEMSSEDSADRYYTEECEALKQTFYKFCEVLKGDITALEVLSDDVMGIGLGDQGYYKNKTEVTEIVEKSMKEQISASDIVVEYGNFDIRFSSRTSATLNVEVHVTTNTNGETNKSSVLQMCSAKKDSGKWLFNLLTVTPLDMSEESVKAYPLAFADETLAKLKGELQRETFDMINDSFAGGILGTYIKDNYPLYFANDTMISMLGYERDEFYELFKDNTAQISASEDKAYMREVSKQGENREEGGEIEARARWTKKNGDYIWVEFRTRKTKDNYGNDIFLSVVVDVTEIVNLRLRAEENQRQAEKKLTKELTAANQKIYHDALTGIYSRRYLDEKLDGLIKSLSRLNGTLCLLMIDIDYFKQYNDTYGHDEGDNCLKAVAETISSNISRSGDFVVRYGGEEFVVVLPNIDESGVHAVATKLLDAVRTRKIPHSSSNIADYVTISIGAWAGVANHRQIGKDYIKRADNMLYKSKREGRNRYTFAAM